MKTHVKKIHAALTACLLAGALFALPAFAADRVPDDTYYPEQWYLKHIGVPEAWNTTLGIETVPIAIIDTGVDLDHPDLKDNIWRNVREISRNGIDDDGNGYIDDVHGWDFIANDNDPRPDVSGKFAVLAANHGTINAGVAAARGNNGRGIVGVTWQSTIMPLRALDSNGEGDPALIIRAVNYAVQNGAKVINLSFAGTAASSELAATLRRAYDSGVFVVAAGGNARDEGTAISLDAQSLYPVCLDDGADENFIFGVAATDDKDVKGNFSNYGAGCIDISAPGARILSTQLWRPKVRFFDSQYGGFYNGTSVAAPIVSGVAALLFSLDRNLTPKQVTNVLLNSAVNIDAVNPNVVGKIGRGRIDARKAVGEVLSMLRGSAPPIATTNLVPPGYAGKFVVAASGAGRSTEVRLFTTDGVFIRGFQAFDAGFKGGASLAVAKFDGAGRQTIVLGALAGGAPQVRIFDINTRNIGGWLAYDSAFRGGVDVAVGDLDGDGKDEVITGAGPGGGPHVRMFNAKGVPQGGFFPFDAKRRTGVRVAAGDLDGDGKAEIIASLPDGSSTRVFNAQGKMLEEFFPFGKGRRGPILSSRVLGASSRQPPTVTMVGTSFSFFAFEPRFKGGVRAALTE